MEKQNIKINADNKYGLIYTYGNKCHDKEMFSGGFFVEIQNNVGSRVADSNERYQLSNSFLNGLLVQS
jgi:hypothetical protein